MPHLLKRSIHILPETVLQHNLREAKQVSGNDGEVF